nr:hypothetical protein [uncultured Acetobacterium sp.]
MNSEELIKNKLTNLKKEYQAKINVEIESIEQKRRTTASSSSIFGKIKATGNAALEKGQKELVKRNYPNVTIVPDISEQMLINISKLLEKQVDPKLIIGIIDTSLLHNGTKGYVFTGEKICLIQGENKEVIELANICNVKMNKININDGKDGLDPRYEDVICISFNDKEDSVIRTFPLEPIFDILKTIYEETTEFEETDQRIKQESLSDIGKMNFVKIAVNYLIADDGVIDPNEYASLVSLISTFDFDKNQTDELREYRLKSSDFPQTTDLIDGLMKEVPAGSREAISLNLIYSLLSLRKETVGNWGDDLILNEIQMYLEISTSKIQFLVNEILNEIRIEKERLSDDKIKEIASNTLAAGSAVGIPFAALAATGVITGWGGLSGGLFALAFASTGGIIVGVTAISAASFGAYKGVKYLTGGNSTEKYLYRQAKLQASLMVQQKTTNMLLQDINWITDELEGVITLSDQVVGENRKIQLEFDQLKNYIRKMHNVSSAAKVSEEKRIYEEKELLLTKIPNKLDVVKLEMLGEKSVDWDKFSSLIYNVFEEIGGEWMLKMNMRVEDYNAALNILTDMGYFKTSAGFESTAKLGFQKIRDTVGC